MQASHKGSYFTVLISLRREWTFQSSYCQQLRHSQMTIYYLTLFLKGEMTASLSKLAGEQLSGAYSTITHSHDLLNRNQDTLFFTQEHVLGHLNLTVTLLVQRQKIAIKMDINCDPITSDQVSYLDPQTYFDVWFSFSPSLHPRRQLQQMWSLADQEWHHHIWRKTRSIKTTVARSIL